MALAQSIIEYIHDRVRAKTMFATHYHELTDLSEQLTRLVNVHVATLERDGEVTFLHKIESGPADKSYGIHVAKIAGLPIDLLDRATDILSQLEADAVQLIVSAPQEAVTADLNEELDSEKQQGQLSLFEEPSNAGRVIEELEAIDIMNLTPMQAMNAIFDLKKLL